MPWDNVLGFASPDFSWTDYLEVRPRYPDSMYKRIYDFHRERNGSWQLAHDIGAGSGFVAKRLADLFEKVAVSEPNEEYFRLAMGSLQQQGKYSVDKYIMQMAKAEDTWLEDAVVDMACMNCMIHWTDPPQALQTVARSLKPGGTLAVLTVSRPRIIGNSSAASIWESMWDRWYDPAQPMYQKEMGNPMVQRGLNLLENWLDNVEFPEHLFIDVRRFHINGPSMACSTAHPSDHSSKIGADDVVFQLTEIADWGSQVDVTWFKKLMTSYPKARKISEAEQSRAMWHHLEEAIPQGQKVDIYWPVGLVLARRKTTG